VTDAGDDPSTAQDDPAPAERRDLNRFIQSRQLDLYEQGMARQTYAYGVDIRRSRWLANSRIGNTLVRAVDRAWPQLSTQLMATELDGPSVIPHDLLSRLHRVRSLLRAPLPSVRSLRRGPNRSQFSWPVVTALGSVHGHANWLVIDIDALRQLPPEAQDFVLGTGLGHLQCDHGIFFSAHLLAARQRATLTVRAAQRLLTPWSRVMAFSADRAGLLSSGSVPTALSGLHALTKRSEYSDDLRHWLPMDPPLSARELALEEFSHSEVFTRLQRLHQANQKGVTLLGGIETSPPPSSSELPPQTWSLARVDSRLTQRLKLL